MLVSSLYPRVSQCVCLGHYHPVIMSPPLPGAAGVARSDDPRWRLLSMIRVSIYRHQATPPGPGTLQTSPTQLGADWFSLLITSARRWLMITSWKVGTLSLISLQHYSKFKSYLCTCIYLSNRVGPWGLLKNSQSELLCWLSKARYYVEKTHPDTQFKIYLNVSI